MLANTIEARSGRNWLAISGPAPQVPESGTLELRGFHAEEEFGLGPVRFQADGNGRFAVRMVSNENLRGHLGLVEVLRDSNIVAGEVEILPDKVSQSAFDILRSDLERAWSGLIFDPSGMSKLPGQLPPPDQLWRLMEAPVRDIASEPRSVLDSKVASRRMETVRRAAELTPTLFRAHTRQKPGRSRVLARNTDIAENALVAEALRRLVSYARRHPEGKDVAIRARRLLHDDPFVNCRALHGELDSVRLLTLHDERYRRVEKVLKILNRPEAYATEGPGEVRLGVRGMIRLYEYWVFLQVLIAAQERYGAPLEPGFAVLGRRTDNGTIRLVLAEETTVRFPGNINIAFEPHICSSGSSWQQLKNVPHPDLRLAQQLITPDVVVLRQGAQPAMLVIDAKYVGLRWVETQAARLHSKYSRIRLREVPVVRHVLAAHPHEGVDDVWAGYGSVPMVPGRMPNIERFLP